MRRGRSSEPDRCQNRSPKPHSAEIRPRLPAPQPFSGDQHHNSPSNASIDFDQSPALWPALPELLFVWVCGLTATLTSEVRNYWRDGLTEFGLEQTMLAL
jgi:hypothetical protein